jgi:hypothetical protein
MIYFYAAFAISPAQTIVLHNASEKSLLFLHNVILSYLICAALFYFIRLH